MMAADARKKRIYDAIAGAEGGGIHPLGPRVSTIQAYQNAVRQEERKLKEKLHELEALVAKADKKRGEESEARRGAEDVAKAAQGRVGALEAQVAKTSAELDSARREAEEAVDAARDAALARAAEDSAQLNAVRRAAEAQAAELQAQVNDLKAQAATFDSTCAAESAAHEAHVGKDSPGLDSTRGEAEEPAKDLLASSTLPPAVVYVGSRSIMEEFRTAEAQAERVKNLQPYHPVFPEEPVYPVSSTMSKEDAVRGPFI